MAHITAQLLAQTLYRTLVVIEFTNSKTRGIKVVYIILYDYAYVYNYVFEYRLENMHGKLMLFTMWKIYEIKATTEMLSNSSFIIFFLYYEKINIVKSIIS